MSPASRILIFLGMTASGKSTLAKALAERHGLPYHNTDTIRKELAGLSPNTKRPDGIGKGIYTQEYTEKTYATALARACADCARGCHLVLLDGSYSTNAMREKVRKAAKEHGINCCFIYCFCSEEITKQRFLARSRDPLAVSDGRMLIYRHQQAHFEVPEPDEAGDTIHLNTEQDLETMLIFLEKQLTLTAQ